MTELECYQVVNGGTIDGDNKTRLSVDQSFIHHSRNIYKSYRNETARRQQQTTL